LPKSISTSRSSSFKISAALSSSMDGSGSPFLRSFRGVVLVAVGGGMKDTDTDVGEIVEVGSAV
jgi:hypothetical protein